MGNLGFAENFVLKSQKVWKIDSEFPFYINKTKFCPGNEKFK